MTFTCFILVNRSEFSPHNSISLTSVLSGLFTLKEESSSSLNQLNIHTARFSKRSVKECNRKRKHFRMNYWSEFQFFKKTCYNVQFDQTILYHHIVFGLERYLGYVIAGDSSSCTLESESWLSMFMAYNCWKAEQAIHSVVVMVFVRWMSFAMLDFRNWK